MDRSSNAISSGQDEIVHTILPLWAHRLRRSSPFSDQLRWPASPVEGLRQSIQLSDLGHRQLIASTRLQHPDASTDSVIKLAYDTLATWEQTRSSLRLPPRAPSRGRH
jgi:hypothetical protein